MTEDRVKVSELPIIDPEDLDDDDLLLITDVSEEDINDKQSKALRYGTLVEHIAISEATRTIIGDLSNITDAWQVLARAGQTGQIYTFTGFGIIPPSAGQEPIHTIVIPFDRISDDEDNPTKMAVGERSSGSGGFELWRRRRQIRVRAYGGLTFTDNWLVVFRNLERD